MDQPPAEEQATPGLPARRPWALHIGLFLATGVTTTLAGVGFANEIPPEILGDSLLNQILAGLFFYRELLYLAQEPARIVSGFTFSAPLLAIFLTHEMGHFVVARRANVPASLPYFIPLPFALGTLGAVISMRAPSRDRGALLNIGAAGPLVGFVVAFAVLLIGFASSELKSAEEIASIAQQGQVVVEGDSVAYALARWLVFGTLAPGDDVWINPTARAGWFGMYLTWLNLLPFSQFDGGHIAYALVGRHARAVTFAVVGVLTLLFAVTINPIWVVLPMVLLAFGFFVIGFTHPPVNDPRPLRPYHKLTAFVCTLVLLGTFVPNPWHPHPSGESAQTRPAATGARAAEVPPIDLPQLPTLRLGQDPPPAGSRRTHDNPLPKQRDPRARRQADGVEGEP